MMTSLIMSIFWKINLVAAKKTNFQYFFSVFESEGNIEIEYI